MITLTQKQPKKVATDFKKPATGGFLLGKRMVHKSHRAYNRQENRQSLRKGDW